MKQLFTTLFLLCIFLLAKGQEVVHTHSVHHSFIENKGQWPEHVFFKNNFDQGNMWVEQGHVLFQLQDYSILEDIHFSGKEVDGEVTFKEKLVKLEFVNALHVTQIEKTGESDHYYNYFIGNDEDRWASDVRSYETFTLKEIYKGIDLRFIEQEKQIKYEFHVAPNVEPNQIQLRYFGQEKMWIDRRGRLVVKTELGNIIEEKPYAYQIVNGKIVEVECAFELKDGIVSFKLGDYNKRVELIIDPTLIFATYCGAVSDNFGMTATYGYDGSAYSAGTIYGNSHPMPDLNAYDVTSNFTVVNVGVITTDGFITKYAPDGTTMLWATFYGGGSNTEGTDVPHSLICDLDDNIYVFGTTSSLDFPIVNGFQPTFGGGTPIAISYNGTNFGIAGTDIYVAKFSANGHNLLGSTYVGGDKNDGINYMISSGNYPNVAAYDSLTMNYGDQFRGEIMLDSLNNIIVGSCTRSDNFPTKNPFQATRAGQQDGVVFKLKNDFSDLIFSSFYGGEEADAIYSVKIDSSYNIVFGGGTISPDIPITTGTYQSSYGGGKADGFIGKLSPDGTTLTHSTYVGTSNYDQIFFVEIDRNDNIFVLGQSNGGSFPVVNASYFNPNSSQFIAKFDPDLIGIENSTIFGSGSPTFDVSPAAFMVDICGNIYVSSWGGSVLAGAAPISNMPITADAFQPNPPNGFDFHLMVIERGFSGLLYGTYLGGAQAKEHVDGGTSRFDKNGIVYQSVCGGCPGLSDFPTTPGAWSNQNLANNCNALTFKFDFNLIPNAEFTVDNSMGCAPFEVQFENFSSDSDSYFWDFGDGNVDSTTFEPVITYSTPGVYEVMLSVTDSICLITDSAKLVIEVFPAIDLSVSSDVDLCEPVPIDLEANSNGTATSFVWSSNANFTDTLNSSTLDSLVTIQNPTHGYYYVIASNNGCSVVDSVFVNFTNASLDLIGNTNLCLGEETTIQAISTNPNVTFSDFQWAPSSIILSGNGTNTVTVAPNSSQYLYVEANANNGCDVVDSILILVSDIDENSIVASVSDDNVPIGEDVVLSVEPSGYSYTWTPADGVSNPNAQETSATVYQSTEYTVYVTDGICTKSSSVWVNAFPYTCEEPFIFVPNAFTPNGDGNNDVLYLRSKIIQDVIFRIYDRWGELVFESTNLHTGWDGTFRGKALKPDVYDYYLEGHCIDNQEFVIKGNVTLIR